MYIFYLLPIICAYEAKFNNILIYNNSILNLLVVLALVELKSSLVAARTKCNSYPDLLHSWRHADTIKVLNVAFYF